MAGNCDTGCCSNGKLITVLSIDGGGARGIIPGKILAFLETELKRLDGDKFVSISEYFDMIAGTSTGGLIAAMLTTPKPSDPQGKQPIKPASDICNFYRAACPRIFSPQEKNTEEKNTKVGSHLKGLAWSIFLRATNAKYKGTYLRQLIKELVGERKIGETLTNVLLTSFDIKLTQPTIFSTLRAKANDVDDSLMANVCISTTAAPTYFPPYYFKNTTLSITKEFNLVDGGVAANNPTLLAIGEMEKEMKRERTCNKCSNKQDMYLVLSLGTGEVKNEGKLVVQGRNWGFLDWLSTGWFKGSAGSCPIIDCFANAASDMVDLYTAMYFLHHEHDYLRIQCENLESSEAAMDDVSEENLKKLERIGEQLLNKPVASVDLETGQYRPVSIRLTNREALIKFAKRLSDEKKRRVEKNVVI